ncbi:MAG: hypothetical protein COB36_12265 [Alphaproteobacteria bacterium]|nr:MAG: hypothetical protein COB36_12265 [Alphaproteobacteria bacterium]
MPVDWETHLPTLRKLAASKNPLWSASDIASVIGCSKGAVSGAAHRNGISLAKPVKHRKPTGPVKKPVPKPRDPEPRPPKRSYVPTPPKPLPEPDRTLFEPLDIDLMELDATTCRFPTVSPPTRGEHLFCGHITDMTEIPNVYERYCPYHTKIISTQMR